MNGMYENAEIHIVVQVYESLLCSRMDVQHGKGHSKIPLCFLCSIKKMQKILPQGEGHQTLAHFMKHTE
ncbi:hypothetical protein HispidOSU_007418, partial [Sigmodon hispidus]